MAICFENGVFWVLMVTIVGITAYHIWMYKSSTSNDKKKDIPQHDNRGNRIVGRQLFEDNLTQIADDAITSSDYRKLVDPLTEPGRRAARDQIPPAFVAQWLNIETNPRMDRYTSVGYLYRADAADVHNRMVRLLSRQDRYRSTKQDYYAITKDGIKIQVGCNKDEFNDGDVVTLSELGGEYKVKIYSRDDPAYNPYLV